MTSVNNESAIDRLIAKIVACDNPSVIGLDTDFDYLPDDMKEGVNSLEAAAENVFAFNTKIIENIYDIVPAVKVQVAYYEKLGIAGMKAFYNTIKFASARGLIVISDCKRNDIGSTMGAYSSAYLGAVTINSKEYTGFPSDFLTVNPYLGSDGISPLLEDCSQFNKGIFVLIKTSNPGSAELQDLRLENGRLVYEQVADFVTRWGADFGGKYGYSSVGAVVGATHQSQAENIRKQYPSLFFLVPGYGAQGGGADAVAVCFDHRGLGAIVNNSRGILLAYRKDYPGESYYTAARLKCIAMRDDINAALTRAGKKI